MTDPDYFTLAAFRGLADMSDTTKYSDAAVLSAAAYVTAIVEREVGTSFIARTITSEVYDGGGREIVLRRPFVQSVTSATEDGVAVTDQLRVKSGILRKFSAGAYSPNSWSSGIGNVSVTYVHGYSTLATIPSDIQSAVMQGTRARLMDTSGNAGINDRRTSLTNETGTVSFVIAGEGRPTGYPVVDEVIMGWKRKLDVFGFA
jgi:hypothetical protein